MFGMILAAGRGERLRPVTDTVPKALVEVRGEPLIDRHLKMLASANIKNVVINLDWLGEQIVEHIGSGEQFGVQVVYSPEFGNVLETGGGIYRALPMLGAGPFWVVNGDIYTDMALPTTEFEDDVLGELMLVPTPPHKPKGDFDLHNGRVRFADNPGLTFSGVARYRPEFFTGASEGRYSLAPMLFEAAKRGQLRGNLFEGVWEDIGSPDRLALVNRR
ncbi:MAG: nucleotidyltransferase family protein [Proteobacteria bacterium]|jgi:MurNAc alpha-1-phosphate uridylyltransferase|nr:nucleotidyltransferase family protein [Pseudomonadota bacterium]MDA0995063.1 nucleotidyltransferase family protein [Pseudomonadota bacterium]